jgi:ADP-heptose:LPS heptosyltransferase
MSAPANAPTNERILVIKLGALGDFAQALGPFAAIRRHHAQAHATLMTTAPFAEFAEASGWFDAVWIDDRPKTLQVKAWMELRRHLIEGRFSRVYDLQTSDRSSFYFRTMGFGRRPQWSGIARGCSHPHANPRRDLMHTIERQAEQLNMAGIDDVPFPDLSWVVADTARFGLEGRYALLIPGGAAHRPEKRWPAERYGELAQRLAAHGMRPVLLGTAGESDVLATITAACPDALDLMGETTLADIAALARNATAAIGNDNGPMHLVTLAGCPSVVLYSHDSDPALCAQRGPAVTILRKERLAELSVEEVDAALALKSTTTP